MSVKIQQSHPLAESAQRRLTAFITEGLNMPGLLLESDQQQNPFLFDRGTTKIEWTEEGQRSDQDGVTKLFSQCFIVGFFSSFDL